MAHFIIQALKRAPLTLYGDGMQVRDVLFVEDLVDAMMQAHDCIDRISGEAFNIGGGRPSTVSLLELIDLIGDLLGRRPVYCLEPWRTADQRYYVSDTSKFHRATGWVPRVSVAEGVERLAAWLADGRRSPSSALAGTQVAL